MTAASNPSPPARDTKPSLLMRTAVTLFGLGLIFIVVVFGLFALGKTDLPLWLSAVAIGCTSAGFGLGLIALLREARSR